MSVSFTSHFGAIRAGLRPKAAAIVEKTANDIDRGAMARSRVDTGQMRAGFTVEAHGELSREVYDDVEHTVFNEFGTVHMEAQPMLGPAAEEARPGYEEAMRRLVDQ